MLSKIMLVEDDFALAMATEYALQSEGYQVVCADNLQKARGILDESVDLVLLDLMLPDGNGYSFCKEIRDGGFEMPVIFLTAVSDEANIVQGLELGADDYVTKPYRVKELMSRIAANIRRYERNAGRSKKVYVFGKHKFLPEEFRLLCEDKVVECTASEMRLLKELVMNGDVVLSRNTLLERLYDVDGAFIDDNTLSVYLKRLRDKLGKDADYIETVRGVGYRFVKNRNK